MAGWWKNCEYNARDNLNIIMVDFFQVSGLVSQVIKMSALAHWRPSLAYRRQWMGQVQIL